MLLHIGIDDTDSRSKGMCTTYLAFKMVECLLDNKAEIVDYPYLVRLNPNIPWKTRGNGSVCIRAKVDDHYEIIDKLKALLDRYAYIEQGSNPALVIYASNTIPREFIKLAEDALYKLIPRGYAYKLALKHNAIVYAKGNKQGVVGALASIGTLLNDDHTYELLAYRYASNCSKPRVIDEDSVINMDKQTYPYTFNNYDYKNKRILITPHGNDPVFLGIRGEDPRVLLKAFSMLRFDEELEGYMIFKSNQGTDAHLKFMLDSLEPYRSGYVEGMITSKPYTIKKGHTFFKVNSIECAVYEPTGLTRIAQMLTIGDKVRVGGGVRKASRKHGRVLNVEYINVLKLAEEYKLLNPLCSCGKRLKSAGKDKGYKCYNCGFKGYKEKQRIVIKRNIKEGLYLPLASAQRHLTKPLQRYGLKQMDHELIHGWFSKTIMVAGGGFSG